MALNKSGGGGGAHPEPKPEDIEALLDQVEKSLKSPAAIKLAGTKPEDCPCTEKHPTDWNEVDEMLKDFKFEDNNPFSKSKNKPWARQKIERAGDDNKEPDNMKQCFAAYLSGSYEEMGYCLLGAEKPCSNLKCLRCDFAVVHFDNFAWHSTTDYLFLRNNMPDFDKLAGKLTRRKGSRAYACQCRHVTTSTLMNVMARPELRWVCGKHLIPTTDPLKS